MLIFCSEDQECYLWVYFECVGLLSGVCVFGVCFYCFYYCLFLFKNLIKKIVCGGLCSVFEIVLLCCLVYIYIFEVDVNVLKCDKIVWDNFLD